MLLVTALLAAAFALLGRRPGAARAALLAALAVLGGMLGVRWSGSGHPPVFGTFEMDLAEVFWLLVIALLIERRVGHRRLRAPLVASVLILAHSVTLHTEATPLTISETSLWIDLHALLAWGALCFYLHALFLAFGGDAVQALAVRLLGTAFIFHSALGFVGVYYATILFASPWQWDPVQALGLLAWVLCGLVLHFRLFFNVSLFRQRYLLALLAAVYVLSAKAIMYLPPGQSFHVFELGSMAGR